MNRGLLWKAWRETWPPLVMFSVALFVIETVLAFALPKFQAQISGHLANLPFFRNVISAMIGVDVTTTGVVPELFAAIAWVHPVVLAVVWANAIVHSTRMPAGEVDGGTIDALLSLPVSRWQVFVSESASALVASAALVVAGLAGNTLGARLGGDALGVGPLRQLPAVVNLWLIGMLAGALGSLASTLTNRRGRAASIALLVLVASFLLNYLAQFWEPAKSVEWLSLLRYHQPMRTLLDGRWPVRDFAILAVAAVALWAAAGVVFARRDLATT